MRLKRITARVTVVSLMAAGLLGVAAQASPANAGVNDAVYLTSATKVFAVDFGSNTAPITSLQTGGKVTDQFGHTITVADAGKNLVADPATKVVESPTTLKMNSTLNYNDGLFGTQGTANNPDPDDSEDVSLVVGVNPNATNGMDPEDNDFEFTVRANLGSVINAKDSVNVFQKSFASDPGQYKLQINTNSDKPACYFKDDVNGQISVASTTAVVDGAFHTMTCIREADRIGIKVDAGAITWQNYTNIGFIDTATRDATFANKPNSMTYDACLRCEYDYANVFIATPTPQGAVPDTTGFTNVLDVDLRNTTNDGGAVIDGDLTEGANSERVYLDASTADNDMYGVNGQTFAFNAENNGRQHVNLTQDTSLIKTANDVDSLRLDSRGFSISTRVAVPTLNAGANQIIWQKGDSGEANVRLTVPAGSSAPQCIFKDTATGYEVVASSTNLTAGQFATITCFREASGLGKYGIFVELNDGTKDRDDRSDSGADDIGAITNVKPLLLGGDGGTSVECQLCKFDFVKALVNAPVVDKVPWSSSNNFTAGWNLRNHHNFNGSYNGTNNTVNNVASGQSGRNMTLTGWPNWSDGPGDRVTFDLGGGDGSVGEIGDATPLDPEADDYMVRLQFKENVAANSDRILFQKGTTGQYFKGRLRQDGRVECLWQGSATAPDDYEVVTSPVYVADGNYHVIFCYKWMGSGGAQRTTGVVVDGEVVKGTRVIGQIANANSFLLANTGSNVGGASGSQARIIVNDLKIYKTQT